MISSERVNRFDLPLINSETSYNNVAQNIFTAIHLTAYFTSAI